MPLWLAEEPLVLASRSKARRVLLTAAGIPVDVRPAELDERSVEAAAPAAAAGATAALLAREKAAAVARLNPGRLTLGADQTLALGAERFVKPADRAAARAQLCALRGRTHELHSAIAFVKDANVLFEHVGVARLTMRAFSDRFLDLYLDAIGGAATESVGVYQIEGLGMQLFQRVDGDHFTVLGLPLMETLDFLRSYGCLAP
ncbi:MAG TPA: Maf family protein [Xanthobacteraceae bacterium]|nr:Maf family protein [Xanthobacteraceae bacterium]